MKTKLQLTLFMALCILTYKAQLSGYSFLRPITVSNTSTASAINYQLKLTVNTQSLISSSQLLSSGDDLRFGKTCTGSTLYNYWIESGLNTATTIIWVKIDTIPAGSARTFFMFYGNSGAAAVSSIPSVFVGPNSSTDSVASGAAGGVGNSQRGFRFSPNEDLLITAFGKMEPTGTTRYVTLFDNATQTIVAQTQVSGAAGQYSYGNLTSPFWITQGTQYLLQLYQGASDGYYFGNSSQIGQHLTYYDMRYCNGCTENTFPTNTLSNFHYGYPDLWYWTKTNISPAPTYTIDQGPIVSVIQSTTAACPLAGVSFTAISSMVGGTYTWQPGNVGGNILSVNPSSSSTYTVFQSSGVCSASTTASVLVHPTPAVTISGSIPLCGSGTNVLTASGAAGYLWSTSETTSSISVSPSSTTNYSIIGTSVEGCTNTANTSVTVNPIPAVVIAATSSVICSGISTSLTASGASTYTWNTTATTASISVTPPSTTGYTVIGTSVDGCTNTAAQTITVNATPIVVISASNPVICSGNSTSLTASGANTYSWNTTAASAGIFVSPGASTLYTVLGTSAAGCTNTASQNITVNITPTVSIAVTNPTICSGNSTSLTASGADTYSWNTTATSAGILVSPGTSTLYTVLGTSTAGCTNTAVQSVTVNATPTLSVLASNTAICSGDALNLSVTGASTYTWSTSSTGSVITVFPTTTGSYSVIGESAEGCTNSAVSQISVNITPTISIAPASPSICLGNSISLSASGALSYTWSTSPTGSVISVSPSVTTSYSVIGESAEGCANIASSTVTVHTTPTVSIAASNTVVCAGDPVMLTASGASTYSWDTGAITSSISVNPLSNISYSATGTSTDGCSSSAVQSVSVNPLPAVVATSGSALICAGETATLNATGADSYTWSTSENTSSIIVSPTIATTYSAMGTNSLTGCIATATVLQDVSGCNAISNISGPMAGLKVYPNPNSGMFALEFVPEANIIISNVLGQTVYSQKHKNGSSQINIQSLRNGVYTITVTAAGFHHQSKIIKE